MHVYRLNREVFNLPADHQARRFLQSFIACRRDCVGKEVPFPGVDPIDQAWHSASDGKQRSFSAIMYEFVSFDIVLDGLRSNAPELKAAERATDLRWQHLRRLLLECDAAARADGNAGVMQMIKQTLRMLNDWDTYLACEFHLRPPSEHGWEGNSPPVLHFNYPPLRRYLNHR